MSRWLGRKPPGPEESSAEELWGAYEALLPECRKMLVEPAERWTVEMEREPLKLDEAAEAVLRREIIYYVCFLSTLHCQEILSDWRPFLDQLHARALASLPAGAQEELNARYGSYAAAYEEGMGRNWHAVGRLFVSRLQEVLGDVPRALWSGATFALLQLTRQAAKQVLERLPGRVGGQGCPACGRAGHLERISFGGAGYVVLCNSCIEHPSVRERLVGDFAALFALLEQGRPGTEERIRALAARYRLPEPKVFTGSEPGGDAS